MVQRARKQKARTQKDRVLHVGIDLGTSRSAIAASNGRRDWVESYVGWPRDFVARKALGDTVLFGAEALDNRLSLDVYRPLQHGVIKEGTARDEESVMALIEHLFEMTNATGEETIYAAVGVPAEALKINKLALKEVVAQYANTLMVVSEPFAVAYGQGLLSDALVIDIGAGTTDFCVMHGTMPGEDDQRTILAAGDYIDQQLLSLVTEQYPGAKFTIDTVRNFKEEAAYVDKAGARYDVEVPVNGKLTKCDVTDAIGRACESIVGAILETTIELIARLDPEYQERVRKNIVLAGGGSQIRNLAKNLESALNDYGPSKVTCAQDPLYAGAIGALSLAKDMPKDYWEEM